MSQRIPEFLRQLAGAVGKLVQTSGLERWNRHVRQWAAKSDADERAGLPLLDLPMEKRTLVQIFKSAVVKKPSLLVDIVKVFA